MAYFIVSTLLIFCLGCLASADALNATYPVHNLTRFDSLKIENLAVRANGLILATVAAPSALLLQIDPLGIVPPTTVLEFPGAKGAFGITEGCDDFFYIAAGNFSIQTFSGVPDSFAVFEVNMTGFATMPNGTHTHEAAIRKVAELPNAKLVNGIAAANESVMLVADSTAGIIWKVEVDTGDVSIADQDQTLKGPHPGVAGVNGIKVSNEWLYYTNTGLQSVFRKPILPDGVAHGSPELVASHVFGDDFLVTKEALYVASPANVVLRVADCKQEIIAGVYNSSLSGLIGPTAVQFGRLAPDGNSLYVSTNGGVQKTVEGAPGMSRVDLGYLESERSH